MKKLTFWKSLFLLFALIVGSSNAWGQITIDFEDNALPTGWTNTNDMAVVSNPISNTSSTNGSYCLSTNGKASNSLTSGYIENIVSISVDATRTSNNTTNEVYIDFCPNSSFGSSDTQTQSVTVNKNSWSTSTLTLDGKASGYVRIRRSGGSSKATKFIDNIVITQDNSGGNTPSITASDGNILYNATGGSIGYTIGNEPEPAGLLTAAIKAGTNPTIENFIFGNITDNAVPFTCDANSSFTARTATVTLTYTYNTNETVTKDVTITQAAAPILPISITLSGTYPTTFIVGDEFSHEGMTVTATYSDNSTNDVTANATFTDYDMSATGEQTVTVTYTSNNVSVTQTYNITVNPIPTKTIAQFIAAGGGKCYLTGTVSNIKNATYGNFDLTDASGTIYVYGCLTPAGESAQFSTLDVEVDDVIKVLANQYTLWNSTDEAVNVKFVEEIVATPQTLTVSATNGSVEITGKTLDGNNQCTVGQNTSVTATATPAEHYTFTSWSATGVTLADATANPLTFTMPTNDVTLTANFTEMAKHTATFYVQGVAAGSDANVYEGDAITFPTNITVPTGYTLMGWTTAAIAGEQTTAPATLVTAANMGTTDVSYYAVFAIGSGSGSANTYSLVEDDDDLNDGDNIVIYSTGTYTYSQTQYSFSKANAEINSNDLFSDVDVTVSNDQFTSTEVVPMTLVKSGSSWKLKIGNQYVSAGNKIATLDNTGSLNTISITNGAATITATISSTDYKLQYNPNGGNGRFAYYSSTQKAIKIYKQNGPSYSNYCTTVPPTNVTVTDLETASGGKYTGKNYATMYYSDRALAVPAGVLAKTYKMVSGVLTESRTYENGGTYPVIPAGEAVVLESDAGANYSFAASSTKTTPDEDNALRGTDVATTVDADGFKYYKLAMNDGLDKVGFFFDNADGSAINNNAHKAYLRVAANTEAKNFYLFGEDATTGIANLNVNDNLDVNAPMYNLAGQRVNKSYKGVVIVNGKKMLNK